MFYQGNDSLIRLNPKYILGYIPVNNHHIETIISTSDINIIMMERINDNEPYIIGETVSNYSNLLNKVK